jgi:hypothetical protein
VHGPTCIFWANLTPFSLQTLAVAAGGGWAMHNFSLTPSASTRCTTVAVGSDQYQTCVKNAENLCPLCTGEFTITGPGRPGAVRRS